MDTTDGTRITKGTPRRAGGGNEGGGAAGFDGAGGRIAAAVMARLNADMERAAVAALEPDPDAVVLAVGFGPGVGVEALLPHLPDGRVVGIDPSSVMVEQARRRTRVAVAEGRVELAQCGADDIPWGDRSFDGVVAVNSVQLWEPFVASVHEVARVLRADGTLVTVTHEWAIAKRAPLPEWIEATVAVLQDAGFDGVTHRTDRFRSGSGLILCATKSRVGTIQGATTD
jgi:ubiquinone/menaquinone biosynthesis C-methylase UbiE